jgi:hypothetical protein
MIAVTDALGFFDIIERVLITKDGIINIALKRRVLLVFKGLFGFPYLLFSNFLKEKSKKPPKLLRNI